MLEFSINNVDFIENYAETSGGAIYTNNMDNCKGALFSITKFIGNTA